MKKAFSIITILLAIGYSASSFACYSDGYYRVCPGDRVVSADNYTGTVIGVNPYRQSVVIDLDSYVSHYTYDIRAIYVTRGCVLNLCVGDYVVSADNYRGRVIGINPFTSKVVLDLNSYVSHYSYDIDDVFSGIGCVGEVCVGDDVVSPDNYKGRVIGVNPFTGNVSVDLYSYSSHYSYYFASLFITNTCVEYDTDYRYRSGKRGLVRRGSYKSLLAPKPLF